MSLKIHDDLEQGSDEWLQARCGILTASVVGQLITPKTIKPATNDTARSVMEALIAERLTGHVEPMYVTSDMERGTLDEPFARDLYAEHHAPVTETGFMVRTQSGRSLGYSPDGLVEDDGLIEIKSRKPKIQLRTIVADEVPAVNMAQLQTGLLVSGRAWIDYVSFCGGMPLYVKRVYPDARWFEAITGALDMFEIFAATTTEAYQNATAGRPIAPRIDHYQDMEI